MTLVLRSFPSVILMAMKESLIENMMIPRIAETWDRILPWKDEAVTNIPQSVMITA